MKKVNLKYNPYLVTTEITIDGMTPKANSSLNVGKKRLQEWIEKLPDILIEEYRDSNVTIDFTGTISDYEDVKTAFEVQKDRISAECIFHKTADITDVERTIDTIFQEIQCGPIPELKDQKIITAFQKAKDSKFEINVVATMSSGKSTLINALLGQQLMPAANEATTATIVKIIDTEKEANDFSAVVFDNCGHTIKKIDHVTLEDMKDLNSDIKVSTIELRGKIPFVKSVGMKLVLVDTPGPNNSRDKSHEEMTYKMIADSDKSLVLYVMNGQQLGINDEKIFLDYVCQTMKEGGKQARERFIFAVNKMDAFKPKDEGTDCIERALENVKEGLEERGIHNPNIFPVTACAALELRTDDEEPMALDVFKRTSKKYEAMHFDNYYHFSNLPQSVRHRIEELCANANDDELLEIHTGIISIEQAISQYINKYARTTKVLDLILSFNEKLGELSTIAHLENAIRNDKEAKANLEKQISNIKANIQSAQNAQNRSKSIDNIDLRESVERDVRSYIDGVNTKISKLLIGRSNKVEKNKALKECQELEKECKAISVQVKVQVEKILDKAYKETIDKIVEDYKKYLADLNIGGNTHNLTFNAVNLVSSSLADLSSIIDENTETADESYYETKTKRVFVASTRKWYNPFTWFDEGDHYEDREYKKRIAKYTEYVDMSEVSSGYLIPFRKGLQETQKSAVQYVVSETERLKDYLKKELIEIDRVLNEKLDELSKTEADTKAKAEEIIQKEKNLKWLEDIQKRVNDIIKF